MGTRLFTDWGKTEPGGVGIRKFLSTIVYMFSFTTIGLFCGGRARRWIKQKKSKNTQEKTKRLKWSSKFRRQEESNHLDSPQSTPKRTSKWWNTTTRRLTRTNNSMAVASRHSIRKSKEVPVWRKNCILERNKLNTKWCDVQCKYDLLYAALNKLMAITRHCIWRTSCQDLS